MKLDVDLGALEALVREMGAEKVEYDSNTVGLTPRRKLLQELESGIELSLDKVDVHPGKLLSHQGQHILIYIRDMSKKMRSSVEATDEDSRKGRNKFHISECNHIRKMKEKGYYDRYVATNRLDGRFPADVLDDETGRVIEIETELDVCMFCLDEIHYNGYSYERMTYRERYAERDAFEIERFLRDYATFFQQDPRHPNKADMHRYVDQWPQISHEKRMSTNWTCEICGVELEHAKRLLHVHHKNGVPSDNDPKNLQALCAVCHSEQPFHNHMKVSEQDRSTIEAAGSRKKMTDATRIEA